MSAVVQAKGLNDYAANELTRFVLESGRGGGVLQPGIVQSDQEAPIRKLLREVCALTGMPLRHAPVYTSRSQGAVERWHRTLWEQGEDTKAEHPGKLWYCPKY